MISTISAHLAWHDLPLKTDGQSIANPYIYLKVNGEDTKGCLDELVFAITTYPIDRKFIFTCTCGVAGCAGWFDGIKVKVRRNTVEWTVLDPSESRGMTIGRFHSFNRAQYESVQRQVLEFCKEIAEYRATNPGAEFDYSTPLRATTVEELEQEVNSYKSFNERHPPDLLSYTGKCV